MSVAVVAEKPSVARDIARNYAWLAAHPELALFTGTSRELERELRRRPLTVREWARARAFVAGL